VGAKFIKKKSPPEQHNNVLINGHRQDLAEAQVGSHKPDLTNGHFLTQGILPQHYKLCTLFARHHEVSMCQFHAI
jgi:hypothetical protein